MNRPAITSLLDRIANVNPFEAAELSAQLRDLIAPAVKPLDAYENALVVYLKRTPHGHKLTDVLAIWGWRNAVDPSIIHLSHVAECLWSLCERLDLLGHSFNHFPGGFGGYGVMCDAAPSRDWALLLSADRTALDDPDRVYWFRIVSVLCSRLYMAPVSKLVGYDHDATAGPFGHLGDADPQGSHPTAS
jgi:hypothetical protein